MSTCIHSFVQSSPTLRNPMDCSLPGSSVHGISHARILEQIAISFSRGFSWPRDPTHVAYFSYMGRWILYHWVTWEAVINNLVINGCYAGLISLDLFVASQTAITPSLLRGSSLPTVSTTHFLLCLLQAEATTKKNIYNKYGKCLIFPIKQKYKWRIKISLGQKPGTEILSNKEIQWLVNIEKIFNFVIK